MQEMIHTDLTVTEPSSPTTRADLSLPPTCQVPYPNDRAESASGRQAGSLTSESFQLLLAGWVVCAGFALLGHLLGIPPWVAFWAALPCSLILVTSVEYKGAHGRDRPSDDD
jgi:hypothetical protein